MTPEPVRPKLLKISANIVFGVAAVVALAVVPQVRVDPAANRDAATIAFLVNALLNAIVGVVLLRQVLLRVAGLLAALLGLALLDAAFAFAGHPGMGLAAAALSVCVVGDIGAGVLALIAAVRRGTSVAA